MKEVGLMTCDKVKGLRGMIMVTHTSVCSNLAKLMVKVYILGQMVRYMMVNGNNVLSMDMASGEA